jgi:hypothetical protein
MDPKNIVYGQDVPYMSPIPEIEPGATLVFKPRAMPGSANATQNPNGICEVEK